MNFNLCQSSLALVAKQAWTSTSIVWCLIITTNQLSNIHFKLSSDSSDSTQFQQGDGNKFWRYRAHSWRNILMFHGIHRGHFAAAETFNFVNLAWFLIVSFPWSLSKRDCFMRLQRTMWSHDQIFGARGWEELKRWGGKKLVAGAIWIRKKAQSPSGAMKKRNKRKVIDWDNRTLSFLLHTKADDGGKN